MPYWVITFTDTGRAKIIGRPEATPEYAEIRHASKITDGREYKIIRTSSWNSMEAKREMKYKFLEDSGDINKASHNFASSKDEIKEVKRDYALSGYKGKL